MTSETKAVFPVAALRFLKDLEKNNDREWFQPRKAFYEETVRGPMERLVEALNAEFQKRAPQFVTEPKKAIFRIYRDTRFSKDKTPYKTHIAASFDDKRLAGGAGFYVSLETKQLLAGAGLYSLTPAQLLAVRQHLAGSHQEFVKLSKGLKLEGESLRRPPKGFSADHPAIELLKRKQWYAMEYWPASKATETGYAADIVKTFRKMLPMVEYQNAPLLKLAKKASKDPLVSGR